MDDQQDRKRKLYRRDILLELKRLHDTRGPDSYVLTNNLRSFQPDNREYLMELNQLIHDGVVRIMSSNELKAVTLNPEKMRYIKNELSRWYTSPKFWVPLLIVLGVLTLVLAILE